MTEKAIIRIRFCDEGEARIVRQAVEPDDTPLPPGLLIETRQDSALLFFEITCDRGPESLLATIDDLLASIQLAEKTICRRVAKV